MRELPLRASGSPGSWFATVKGERLACVHDYMCSWANGRRYYDRYVTPGFRQSNEMVAAIRASKRVILTQVKVTRRPDGWENAERQGYIAIWSVEDIEFDEAGLRFRFVDKIATLI